MPALNPGPGNHRRPIVAVGGRPAYRQDDASRRLSADLVAHPLTTERGIVMGRKVAAKAIARCGQRMLGDRPLNGREAGPVTANDRCRNRLGYARRRRLPLTSERPHWLRFLLLFRQAAVDTGALLDHPLPNGMFEVEDLFEHPAGQRMVEEVASINRRLAEE